MRRRRRWLRRLLVLLLLGGGTYWVLSYSVRPVAESWLSRTLGARVEFRRVGFEPIDGVISLEGLVVHLSPDSGLDGRPIVAERARLDVQWLPLVHRRLQVREVALEDARVELNALPSSIPGLATLQSPIETSTLPAGWTLQIDRIALRESRLRLPPEEPGALPFDVIVHDAELTATRRRTSVLGAARNLRLDASFGGGRLRAQGHYSQREDGLTVLADVRASDLPVRRLAEHLPDLGGPGISGRLEAEMRYIFDARRNSLSGWARLRDGKLAGAAGEPALVEVRNAIADVEKIDLRARDIRLRSLVLRGLALRAAEGTASRLLASLATAPADARRRRSMPGAPAWRWAIDRLDATDADLLFGDPLAPLPVEASLRGENLGPRSHWSPVNASLRYGIVKASFDGNVRTSRDQPRLEGDLSVAGLDLPTLATELGLPGAHLVDSGRLTANIGVFLEPGAAGAGLDGRITLAGLAMDGEANSAVPGDTPGSTAGYAPGSTAGSTPGDAAGGGVAPVATLPSDAPASRAGPTNAPRGGPLDPTRTLRPPEWAKDFALGADRVDLYLNVPAPAQVEKGPAPDRRWTVWAHVIGPYLQIARDEKGWNVPALEPETVDEEQDGEAVATPPTASGTDDTPDADGPRLPAAPLIHFASLFVEGGRLRLGDFAATPWVILDVDRIQGGAVDLDLDEWRALEIGFEGWDRDLGRVGLRGIEADLSGGLDFFGEEIPLHLAGPYLERLGVPYRFVGGTGSFVSELRREPEGWKADALVVLSRPRLDDWTEDDLVPELLGMSLSSAFTLLRDPQGDVRIRLPVLDEDTHRAFAVAVYDAVEQAHRSPASGGTLSPTMIYFVPGADRLRRDAAAQLRSIARSVAGLDRLRIELAAPASLQDRRALAERDVLARLEERGGIAGALSLLGVEEDHASLEEALRRRAAGESAELDPYDEERLAELLKTQPPVSADRLRDLGRRRLTAVERIVREVGVSPSQIAHREIPGEDRTTLAAIIVSVRAERRPRPRPGANAPRPGANVGDGA